MKELGSSNYSNLNKWFDSMAINREQLTLSVVSPLLTTKKIQEFLSYLDATKEKRIKKKKKSKNYVS